MAVQGKQQVGDVFEDFKGRRDAMIKALTDEEDEFFRLCDPEKESLCLYAYPEGTWQIKGPSEKVPTELPEPTVGINFARDGMERKEWIFLVANHSYSWLLALAFYYAARFGLRNYERKKLFQMINDLPTIYEAVKMKQKERSSNPMCLRSKSSKKTQPCKSEQSKLVTMPNEKEAREKEEEDGEDEEGAVLCGYCGNQDVVGSEFWICCDMCERWFHGKCVKITPTMAAGIKSYICPTCNNKRAQVGKSKRTKKQRY